VVAGGIVLVGLIDRYWLLGGVFAASNGAPTNNELDAFAKDIESAAGPLVGTAAVAAVAAGGIIYMLSGGDPNRVKMAKNVIMAAIAGVILYIFMNWLLGWLGDIVKQYFPNATNLANILSSNPNNSLFPE